MGGGGDDPAGMGAANGDSAVAQSLRQVDAVRADPGRKGNVAPDQQQEAAPTRDRQQPPGLDLGVGCPKVAVDDGAAGWKRDGDRLRIWRPRRIGKEKQRRQGLPQPSPRR